MLPRGDPVQFSLRLTCLPLAGRIASIKLAPTGRCTTGLLHSSPNCGRADALRRRCPVPSTNVLNEHPNQNGLILGPVTNLPPIDLRKLFVNCLRAGLPKITVGKADLAHVGGAHVKGGGVRGIVRP